MCHSRDAPGFRKLHAVVGAGGMLLMSMMTGNAAAPTGIALSPGSAVVENAPVGGLVGYLLAEDPDVGDTHTFAFVAGAEAVTHGFYISGNELRLVYGALGDDGKPIDFDTAPATFLIRFRVTDSTGNSFEQDVTFGMADDRDEDADDDGLTEAQEEDLYGTSDVLEDSDGDGFSDWIEVLYNSLPDDPNDWPDYPLIGWGNNQSKELQAPDDAMFSEISTGQFHSMGLRTDGTVVAWAGFNGYGQLTVPAGLDHVVDVAAGGDYWWADSAHSLALKDDGTVTAWGCNDENQIVVPSVLTDTVAVAAGRAHSLALRSDGTVVAWGANLHRQASVPPGLDHVVEIAAGGFFSLALKSDGSVVAWGEYFDGLSWQDAGGPVGLSDVVAISAGIYHVLALRSDGTVVCWGYDGDGQSTVPAGLTNVTAVAGGGFHSLALKGDGSVVGWGSNSHGQVSIPSSALTGVRKISAGLQHSLALRDLPGTPAITSAAVISGSPGAPVSHQIVVANATPSQFVAMGLPAGLAVDSLTGEISGTVADPVRSTVRIHVNTDQGPLNQTLWLNLYQGSPPTEILMSPAEIKENSPVDFVAGILNAVDPDAGDSHTFELIDGIGAGDNHYFRVEGNQLVVNQRIDRDYETSTAPLSIRLRARDASLNPYEAVITLQLLDDRDEDADGDGLTEAQEEDIHGTSDTVQDMDGDGFGDGFEVRNGTSPTLNTSFPGGTILVSWGDNGFGQAEPPVNLGEVVMVSSGWRHNLALKSDGTVYGWGWNDDGQTDIPSGLSNVKAVSAGDYHSLALSEDGTVVAWGCGTVENNFGQADVPAGLTDVVAVSAGSYHSVALKQDGTVVAWGDNDYDELAVPPGLDHVVAISAGGYHTLALKDDGSVVAWGWDMSPGNAVPEGLGDVIGIAAGGFHNLALLRGGTVIAWGENEDGQSIVPPDLANVTGIQAGWKHSLAVKADGGTVAWGSNLRKQAAVPLESIQVREIAAGDFHNLVIRRTSGFPVIQPGGLVRGWPGQTVAHQVVLDGAVATPNGFSAMGLPSGLSIDPMTGLIGGTVTSGEKRVARIMVDTDKGLLTQMLSLDTVSGSPPTDITFTPVPGQAGLTENSPPGTPVGNLATIDPDAGDSHSYFVRVIAGSPDAYCLTVAGNELRVLSSTWIDYEAGSSLTVLVRSVDQGDNFVDKTFVIPLLDDRTEDFDGDGVDEATEEDVYFTSDTHFDTFATADADGDGIPTLIEVAFNLNPQVQDAGHYLGGAGSTSGLPIYQTYADAQGQKRLRMEYLRKIGSGFTYVPQFSGGMDPGQWHTAVQAVQVTPVNASWERCTVEDVEVTPSPARRFGRVKVSQ